MAWAVERGNYATQGESAVTWTADFASETEAKAYADALSWHTWKGEGASTHIVREDGERVGEPFIRVGVGSDYGRIREDPTYYRSGRPDF